MPQAELAHVAPQGERNQAFAPCRQRRPDLGERRAVDVVHDDQEAPLAIDNAANAWHGNFCLREYEVERVGLGSVCRVLVHVLRRLCDGARCQSDDAGLWMHFGCAFAELEELCVAQVVYVRWLGRTIAFQLNIH